MRRGGNLPWISYICLSKLNKTTERLSQDTKTTERLSHDTKTTETLSEDTKTTETLSQDTKTTETLSPDNKTTETLSQDTKTTETLRTGDIPAKNCIDNRDNTIVSKCNHLLTMVRRSRIFLPWRWRRYFRPKHRFTQDLHGATSQEDGILNCYILLTKEVGLSTEIHRQNLNGNPRKEDTATDYKSCTCHMNIYKYI
jgi:hypothetical protein